MQPLTGILVVDFTRYLPGAYASRELTRLGARVVRVEPPEGDPMRPTASAWDAALRDGSESVVCDLKTDRAFARALFPWMDMISIQGKTNFFEKRVGDYQKAGVMTNREEQIFSMEAEF